MPICSRINVDLSVKALGNLAWFKLGVGHWLGWPNSERLRWQSIRLWEHVSASESFLMISAALSMWSGTILLEPPASHVRSRCHPSTPSDDEPDRGVRSLKMTDFMSRDLLFPMFHPRIQVFSSLSNIDKLAWAWAWAWAWCIAVLTCVPDRSTCESIEHSRPPSHKVSIVAALSS